mmetsp:Transcript_9002/g.33159  ORF Transcript_9002/g.33159 Transcript_9002/m.33159 type:complete len:209 (-) Transcript_9002:336-962(-)
MGNSLGRSATSQEAQRAAQRVLRRSAPPPSTSTSPSPAPAAPAARAEGSAADEASAAAPHGERGGAGDARPPPAEHQQQLAVEESRQLAAQMVQLGREHFHIIDRVRPTTGTSSASASAAGRAGASAAAAAAVDAAVAAAASEGDEGADRRLTAPELQGAFRRFERHGAACIPALAAQYGVDEAKLRSTLESYELVGDPEPPADAEAR